MRHKKGADSFSSFFMALFKANPWTVWYALKNMGLRNCMREEALINLRGDNHGKFERNTTCNRAV